MRPDLLIFDWNGTIQDDLHHIYECGVQRIFAYFGLQCPTMDQYRNEVAADFMPFYYGRGIPTTVTAQDLNAIMAEGFKVKGKPPGVFADAHATVAELRQRGYAMVLASGYDSTKLAAAVERNGFAPFFSAVVGDVRDKKTVFAELALRHGRPGGYSAAIGDTDEDALAAAHIQALPIICPRGFHSRERIEAARPLAPSLQLIESLDELLSILH